MNIARPRNVPRNIHLRSSTCVRMVPFYYGNRAEYVLESPQCDSVDESQAVSFEKSVPFLYYICDSSSTVLGTRNLCEFYLL